jgi:type II secretion system protein N
MWRLRLGRFASINFWSQLFSGRVIRTLYGYLRAWLPAFVVRNGWLWYGLVCFVVFFLLTFPSGLLLQRLSDSLTRGTGVQIRYAEGELTWRGGCVLRDVTIETAALRATPVQLTRLTVQPALLSLLWGQAFPLTFATDLYGGTLTGRLWQHGTEHGVHFSLHQLVLGLLPLPAPWGQGRVTGQVTTNGDVQGNLAAFSSLQGSVSVTVDEGALPAGMIGKIPLPALHRFQIQLRARLTGGQLEVSELALNTEGVEAHARGVVSVRTPFSRSELDLQLLTRVTGSPPPAVAALVSFLPPSATTPGERRAAISGSVAAPVVK